MSLQEALEELRQQQKEAIEREEKEAKPEDEVADEVVEEQEPEAEGATEEKVEEKAEEKPAEEAKAEPEKTAKTSEDYFKEREAKRQAKLAEQQQQKPVEQPQTKTVNDPEPNPADDPEAHTAWKLRQTEQRVEQLTEVVSKVVRGEQQRETLARAEQEFSNYEAGVRTQYSDFKDVSNHYVNVLAAGIKALYPDITPDKLGEAVKMRVMQRAGEFQRLGYENPVEAMYHECKAKFGYTPPVAKTDDHESTEEKQVKPDMKKVAENRARNAGTAGAAGRGSGGQVTRKALGDMTTEEYMKIPYAERVKIIKGAHG